MELIKTIERPDSISLYINIDDCQVSAEIPNNVDVEHMSNTLRRLADALWVKPVKNKKVLG